MNTAAPALTQPQSQGRWVCLPPAPQTWVQLWQPPNEYAHDEALLQCPYDDGRWAAWIPDFGPVDLSPTDFCRLR